MSRQQKTYKQPQAKLQTTTLWDFPSQHYGDSEQGSKDYIGATPSYVIWNLLHRYTKPGDKVLDPMCGSGTTIDVAKDMGRVGYGFDLVPSRADIKQADARKIPLESGSMDFAFVDPPYSTHVDYSDNPACIGKLDAHEDAYYLALESVLAEMFRTLKDGGYGALYVSDSFQKNQPFCPIGFELFMRIALLFVPVDVIAVTRHNKSLKKNHWHTSALEGNFFLRGFNHLFIFRKVISETIQANHHKHASHLSETFRKVSASRQGAVFTPQVFSDVIDEEVKRVHESSLKPAKKPFHRKAGPDKKIRPAKGKPTKSRSSQQRSPKSKRGKTS